ncbi:Uncharacterized protein QTN25_001235 [Entamoeba marina]
MQESNSKKVKPPEESDEPPLGRKKPFFISKRKSKDLESQIQGVLLRQLIMCGYDIVIRKPKTAKMSLPFLTILAVRRRDQYIEFKKEVEKSCKRLEEEKSIDGRYPQSKLMKYTQRNRIALTCNNLLELVLKEGYHIRTKKCKESIETVQLIKFSDIWNDRYRLSLNNEEIQMIGTDMINFIVETFSGNDEDALIFGRSYYYGYQSINLKDEKRVVL